MIRETKTLTFEFGELLSRHGLKNTKAKLPFRARQVLPNLGLEKQKQNDQEISLRESDSRWFQIGIYAIGFHVIDQGNCSHGDGVCMVC